MNVAEVPGGPAQAGGARVRDLLLRCGAAVDPAERAVLLTRIASELDQAACEVVARNGDHDVEVRELAAGLRGQAGMARFMAELDRTLAARRDALAAG
jgi:hypothetical protein